jgi:hypothetical protein
VGVSDLERVRSRAEARELRDEWRAELREERREDRERLHASDVAAPTGAGAAIIVAEDGDGIDLDLDQLNAATAALDQRYQEIAGYLREAVELDGRLADGSSPVTRPMRRAFGIRGGAEEGGIQAALRAYLEELDAMRVAIRQVGALHQAQDEQAALAMNANRTV